MLPSIFSENMFDDFFSDPFDREFLGAHNPLYGKHAKNMMKTDVRDNGDRYDNTKNKLNNKLLFDCIWKNESGYAILNVRLNA